MFILSEETKFDVEAPHIENWEWVLWRESGHTIPGRLGLVILANAKVKFESVKIEEDFCGLITLGAGLPLISDDGLDVIIKFRCSESMNTKDIILLRYHIDQFNAEAPWYELIVPLESVRGKTGNFIIECGPGPENNPLADHLSIYEFVIASKFTFNLNRARAFMKRRMNNEKIYFSSVYEHSLYNQKDNKDNKNNVIKQGIESIKNDAKEEETTSELVLQPTVENVYSYAMRNLYNIIESKSPDFKSRLKNKVIFNSLQNRKIKILSLCSGSARVEEELIKGLPKELIDLTLIDINQELLEKARERLGNLCNCSTKVYNINEVDLTKEKYDIILCVSALHHIVELEHVMNVVSNSLKSTGEFWVIKEYVGMNGNRLWPEAYQIANEYFEKLPEKYRKNKTAAHSVVVDKCLPNVDCSINVFEGIRSQDIEEVLKQFFQPISIHKCCCFLWRLLDLAYCDNYNTLYEEDLEIVNRMIELELMHYYNGGRATILDGVYRKIERKE